MKRHVVAVVVAMAGFAPAVPPAQAAPSFSTLTATDVTPRGERYTYRLTMKAGARDERFNLRIQLPCYVAGCRAEPAGYILDETSAKVLGPGDATLQRTNGAFASGSCVRGATSFTSGGTFNLPAGTTTTLNLRYRPLRPWDDTNYRVRFVAGGGTLARRQTLLSETPVRLNRRRGVRFALTSRPSLPFFGAKPVRRRSLLRIAGQTEAGLVGRTVALRYRYSPRPGRVDEARSRPLVSVRVDRRGRFRYRMRPAAHGEYSVYASYAGDRLRVRDRSCPLRFGVSR